MELKKDKQWYITVHRIWSKKEKIDFAMRQMKLSSQSHIKYVSFSNSTQQERLRALQLNK